MRFNVFCHTEWGQDVYVLGSGPELGEWDRDRALKMAYTSGGIWTGVVTIPDCPARAFEYKYIIKADKGFLREETYPRSVASVLQGQEISGTIALLDTWDDPSDPDSLFRTAPFVETIFKRTPGALYENSDLGDGDSSSPIKIRLRLLNPRVCGDDVVAVIGSIPSLGEGDKTKAVPMDSSHFPYWTLDLTVSPDVAEFSYTYIVKERGGRIIAREESPERNVHLADHLSLEKGDGTGLIQVTDNKFHYEKKWKGAGIAIPVFSIRTEKGLGVGEFCDLKDLAEWARSSGFQLIQMLPINDTSAYMSWMDSYPYSCISVFALHPLYLNLEAIGDLPAGMAGEIALHRTSLNNSPVFEYERVMAIKRPFLMRIFEAQQEAFLSSVEFNLFLTDHGHWLKPYAVFSSLRDHFRTGDFTQWGPWNEGKSEEIEQLASPGSEFYGLVSFYYFIQYHLHLQLLEASRYAKERGVVLKGDIPIGIQKRSDSCWIKPELFHMDRSAGAPPDPFSDSGQNWGFPTYNWEKMAGDGYSWWQRRMRHMSLYFQMIRLDHVLGFFRIWEIPDEYYSGLMGHFNPVIPVTEEELAGQGFRDLERLTEPYIPRWLVRAIFGADTDFATVHFLEETKEGFFRLKSSCATQRGAVESVDSLRDSSETWNMRLNAMQEGLFTLIMNVLFLKDPEGPALHPRINIRDSASFACLEGWMRESLYRLYNDYFYHRQEEFWRDSAMIKLPVLKKVSNMLVCGEDLGMIPDCVPGVMEELCLLGLQIQRMPKESDREFGYPWDYSYLTVCSTSSHDMSTLRGWWEEDKERTKRFYHKVLGREGEPPLTCEAPVAREIIRQHLESPSMWAVFPLQDILAMSADLRRPGAPQDEQINMPSDPHHLWNFRLHLSVEKLREEHEFNENILKMVRDAGRLGPY
ncbi:MAG TPA: 4-alpha-glucanotransferase [Syntrophorhabdaceae bacterium]